MIRLNLLFCFLVAPACAAIALFCAMDIPSEWAARDWRALSLSVGGSCGWLYWAYVAWRLG